MGLWTGEIVLSLWPDGLSRDENLQYKCFFKTIHWVIFSPKLIWKCFVEVLNFGLVFDRPSHIPKLFLWPYWSLQCYEWTKRCSHLPLYAAFATDCVHLVYALMENSVQIFKYHHFWDTLLGCLAKLLTSYKNANLMYIKYWNNMI